MSEKYSGYLEWKKWDQEPFGRYKKKEHYYFNKMINFASGLNQNSIVLEIGFGNGGFAGWLEANYPHATWNGVEVQKSLVEKAKEAGFWAAPKIQDINTAKKYDLILALDVIEHLSDTEIADFFLAASKLIKPNGIVLIRTPNAGGPLGLPNQTGDPTHITPVSLSRLANYLNGWEIHAEGDLQPIWEGRIFSAMRNIVRLLCQTVISSLVRFSFAPQPRTLLASNLHLKFKLAR